MADPISTGRYKIVNVRFSNLAALPDENEGSPVSASVDTHNIKEFWNVTVLSNGKYTIENFGSPGKYANTEHRAKVGSVVESGPRRQQWTIQECREKGQYIICTTDSKNLWGLADGEEGTGVVLAEVPTDKRNQWKFNKT